MVDKELLLGSRSSDQLERLDDEAHRILAMRDCLIDVCEHCFETWCPNASGQLARVDVRDAA